MRRPSFFGIARQRSVGVGFANVVQEPVARGIAGKNKVVREMDLDNKKNEEHTKIGDAGKVVLHQNHR
jgi:hypothetical protein